MPFILGSAEQAFVYFKTRFFKGTLAYKKAQILISLPFSIFILLSECMRLREDRASGRVMGSEEPIRQMGRSVNHCGAAGVVLLVFCQSVHTAKSGLGFHIMITAIHKVYQQTLKLQRQHLHFTPQPRVWKEAGVENEQMDGIMYACVSYELSVF